MVRGDERQTRWEVQSIMILKEQQKDPSCAPGKPYITNYSNSGIRWLSSRPLSSSHNAALIKAKYSFNAHIGLLDVFSDL